MQKFSIKQWFKAAIIRAIKTMAQTIVGMVTIGVTTMTDPNWVYIFSVAVVSGFISILTSIGGLPETSVDGAIEVINEEESEIQFNPIGHYASNSDLEDGSIIRLKVNKK